MYRVYHLTLHENDDRIVFTLYHVYHGIAFFFVKRYV